MNIKKTPVSMLQEMMVKKGETVSYELIHNGGGTHENIFTYQVACDGLSATGTGRCKKDAKHEAASKMLENIAKHQALPQLPATPCESPVRTPLPMELPVCPKSPAHMPFRNAIGELQDLCSTNNLDDPDYKEIGDIGPPHARVFTIKCTVSTFVEEGTATTKKQAKHEAARKMVIRIKGVVSDEPILEKAVNKANYEKEQIASQIAMAKYPALTIQHATEATKSKVNWGLKLINYHQTLKTRFGEDGPNLLVKLEDLLAKIHKCRKECCDVSFTKLKEEIESTLQSVDIQYSYNSFECKGKEPTFMLGLQLNTAPDIHEIVVGKTQVDAEMLAFENVIETLMFFLK